MRAPPHVAVAPMPGLRQIVRLAAALAALGTAIASVGGAAAQSDRQADALDGKLRRETEHLAASGFERIGGDTIAAAKRDEPSVIPVDLDGGATYAVVAACGEGCDRVEIALFDPAQNLLHRSPEASDVVIVSGLARQSGVYGIGLSVPGCRKAACPIGFVLLRQAPPAGPAAANAAPPAAMPPSVSVAPDAPPSPSAPTTAGAGGESLQALNELAKLAVSAREAERARERTAAPAAAPVATDAETAPGRPSPPARPAAAAKPAASAQGAPRPPAKSEASQASCQQMEQQYLAYARTAGAPGTMPELFRMYQYLQCNCGHPPSPQLPPCPR